MPARLHTDDAGVQRELALLPDRLDRVDELLASGLIGGVMRLPVEWLPV
jgi:hypothetical protein